MKNIFLILVFHIVSFGQSMNYYVLDNVKLEINKHTIYISGTNTPNHTKLIEFKPISKLIPTYSYNTMRRGKLRFKMNVLSGYYVFKVITKDNHNNIIFIQDKIIQIK